MYRLAGCVDPTYRVEAKVIAATGKAEECGVTAGLDPQHCATLAKFIAAPPMGSMKRSAAEEEREAVEMAAVAVKIVAPFTEGLEPFLPDAERKRQSVGDTLLSQLQVCSPLISAGLKVIEAQVKLPINVSDHLGPCGTICNYAVCGLNILCQATARPILQKINSDRSFSNCPALACAAFSPSGIDQCGNATCPNPEGFWQSNTNCLPPKKVKNPTRADKTDCCQTCEDRCNGVRCPAVACPEPSWPTCRPYVVGKYDQFDCCEQCIDPCQKERAACPPPPQSCPPGQFVGPAAIGDCCLSCQPLCVGVSCAGAPAKAADCPAGQVFQDRPASVNRCGDCCPKCVPKAGSTAADLITNSAAAFSLAAAAAFVAALATTF